MLLRPFLLVVSSPSIRRPFTSIPIKTMLTTGSHCKPSRQTITADLSRRFQSKPCSRLNRTAIRRNKPSRHVPVNVGSEARHMKKASCETACAAHAHQSQNKWSQRFTPQNGERHRDSERRSEKQTDQPWLRTPTTMPSEYATARDDPATGDTALRGWLRSDQDRSKLHRHELLSSVGWCLAPQHAVLQPGGPTGTALAEDRSRFHTCVQAVGPSHATRSSPTPLMTEMAQSAPCVSRPKQEN